MDQHIIAIDFGTSNSLVAAANAQKILTPFSDANASHTSPILKSVFYAPEKGLWMFGNEAIEEYTKFGGQGRLLRSIKKFLPAPSFEGTYIHGEYFSIVDLVSLFLKKLRDRANRALEIDCQQVVMGRPALFSADPEKDKLAENRLKAAAIQAGFEEVYFCAEPIAAALAFKQNLETEKLVFVADFGGGTSDFTLLKLSNKAFQPQDVLAIHGLSVAGDKFDGSIMKHNISQHFGTDVTYKMPMGSSELSIPKNIIQKMCSPADMSLLAKNDIISLLKSAQKWSLDPKAAKKMDHLFTLVEEHLGYKIYTEIEKTKISLSSQEESQFVFEHYEVQIHEVVQRGDFQSHSAEFVDQITRTIDETMQSAGVLPKDIDLVCCTGGTSQLPALQNALIQRFGKDKLNQFENFQSVVGGLSQFGLNTLNA